MCGRYPFYDTSASKLEEIIKSGKLTYAEPEWKSISDKGMYIHVWYCLYLVYCSLITGPLYSSNLMDTAKSLISRMLHVDTTRRLRAGEVLNDPWIMVSHVTVT